MMFADRTQAGQLLAGSVEHLAGADPIVLGIPRGGVPVGYEVAVALGAPLDVIVVRKVGVPFQPELAMGAVGENGVRVVNEEMMRLARVSADDFAEVEKRERAEVQRRAAIFRDGAEAVSIEGRMVIIVDDGIATGSTARAALQIARARGAARVVLAVPVAAAETLESMRSDADEVIAIHAPSDLGAVGYYYRDFRQTTDADVVRLLGAARDPESGTLVRAAQIARDRFVARNRPIVGG